MRLDRILLVISFTFFVIGDTVTTLYGLQIIGVYEQNKVVKGIVKNPTLFILYKTTIYWIFYIIGNKLKKRYYMAILTGISIVGICVTGWNIIVINQALS
jgi:hypothetical protein